MYQYSWEEIDLIKDELEILEIKDVFVITALTNMSGENHDA